MMQPLDINTNPVLASVDKTTVIKDEQDLVLYDFYMTYMTYMICEHDSTSVSH